MALSDIAQEVAILRKIGQIKEDHQRKKYFIYLIAKLPIKKRNYLENSEHSLHKTPREQEMSLSCHKPQP